MLEVKNAFFCDAAIADSSGKVSVLGIFTNINAKQFPAKHPNMTLVAIIEGHRIEAGLHQIKIDIVDSDGHNIVKPIEGTFEIAPNRTTANFILSLQQTTFTKPGTYSADIAVDKRHLRSVTLNVVQV
ncbi:MAG: hypothetical protein A4E53_03505 [Pelotomaculum sp. PtaB.Bin104]|nr:MAG: hypothetical protein A4E53_03505 [Pelotomaculum sp. PtaB.Bin104]